MFFVFFRVGERNVFFLSFIVLVVVVMEGEESSTRGDVMPMISLFSLLSPNGWCHVYFWLNIRFLWDSYNYSDLKMEGSFLKIVLAPNLRLQLPDSRKSKYFLTKKCTIRLKNHFEDHPPEEKNNFLTSFSPWLSIKVVLIHMKLTL